MASFPKKWLHIVEQLSPAHQLGASTKGVIEASLRNAFGPKDQPSPKPQPPQWSCLAPSAPLPDLGALRGAVGLRRTATPAPTGGRFLTQTVATQTGTQSFKLYQPDGDRPPEGLILMLHGCSQDPDDFAAGTGMNRFAAAHHLLVAYPEQSRRANMSRCWNWFLPDNQHRDGGEPAAIAAVVRTLTAQFGLAPGRVMVAGLSAGGAMAAIMAEAYPDLLGAVGIHSGLPVGAAHDVPSAFAAMREGGAALPEAVTLRSGVPTIVFHGDADTTVHPTNAAAIVARIEARESGLQPQTSQGRSDGGRAYQQTVGRDAAGRIRFESWTVRGSGHAWSGGDSSGSHTDPAGPDASAEMVRFFLDVVGPSAR